MTKLLPITKSCTIMEMKFHKSYKKEYYNQVSNKVRAPSTSSNTYWSILRIFYSDIKINLIPPLAVKQYGYTKLYIKFWIVCFLLSVLSLSMAISYCQQVRYCSEQKRSWQQSSWLVMIMQTKLMVMMISLWDC